MNGDGRLDSWKEIAAYLGREVRTVQLWEKGEGLPIHRHQHARQGSVYAFKPELDAWREARKSVATVAEPPAKNRWPAVTAAVAGVVLLAGGFLLWSRHSSGEGLSSVAVLPFLDFSPQHDQEYFSDGLTEEIIDALSRVPNLRVVARTSAFAFKGKSSDIRQIGQQLNVTAVLEGSVRKAGDQLRITAQLNRVSDGTHLWSRTYDRQLRDVFAVQREISQAIADMVRGGEVPSRVETSDLEAYRLYQEGRYFFNQFQPPESNLKAIDRYQQAIARDPKFARAYAGLSEAYAYLAENFVVAPREVMPKAKEAAEKAVALDPNSADAHVALGAVKLDYDRDRTGAAAELERALQINPGFAWARHWYAHSLEAQDRLDDAMKEMNAALALDPLSIPIQWDIGSELLCAHRYEDAVRHLEKAGELFPNIPTIDFLKVEAYYRKGDRAASRRLVERMKASKELADEPFFLSVFGAYAAREGRIDEARQVLARLEHLQETRYVEPFLVIELCSALKDHQKLMLWMKRLDEERSTLFVYVPMMAEYYNDDPEARALVAAH